MKFDKLIILDLDETLVHATGTELDRVADFIVGEYFVYLRPHVHQFIDFCFHSFIDVAVWTSSSSIYANNLYSKLFGDRKEKLAFL